MNNNEYRRCFDKWIACNDKKPTFAMFDWYEIYPMIFAITPLHIRLRQRMDFFKTDCYNEVNRRCGGRYDEFDFKEQIIDDGYILECYFKGELYRKVKLLKNNKVDFTYIENKLPVMNEYDNYIENLTERYTESIEAISNVASGM